MTGPGGRSDEPRTWFVDPLTGQPLEPETEAERTRPIPVVLDTVPARRRLRLRPTLGIIGLIIVLAVGTTATYQAKTAPPPPARDIALPDPVAPTRIEPVIAGWQPVQSDDHPLVFDVPPDWKLEKPDVAIGYETPEGDLVTLQGVARYHRDFCPGSDLSSRAMAGFTTIDEGEVGGTTQAAEETTLRWAEAAYGSDGEGQPPKTEVGQAGPVTMLDGGATATAVTTTVVPAPNGPCPAPSVAITAIALPLRALPGSGRYHVLLVLADQGIPDAVARDIVLKMGETIRRE
ncbi:hypothetical protein AB0N89_23305 [Amycolatopsis sp. NPDC089917]|uniref:hypothetical protein n=1 Tax=Amycolatopsis sp. NPDC089917 TaxID=3155187 RepID=UPI00343551CC